MKRRKVLIVLILLTIVSLVAGILIKPPGAEESIKQVMKDAVIHNINHISFFDIEVNPAVISGFIVTLVLLLGALLIRVFVIPKFSYIPKKFQLILETVVGYFKNLAKTNSPEKNYFLGVYVFSVGTYIFVSTLFELLGIQAITTTGSSISLPAPISDINSAISLGVISYLVILSGGISSNGFKGILKTLKEFSLPISMSFRLFGALLGGLLVNELVYYFVRLSFILPVIVAVLFTLLHALIQAYVLTMLTALFYGEVSEKSVKKID